MERQYCFKVPTRKTKNWLCVIRLTFHIIWLSTVESLNSLRFLKFLSMQCFILLQDGVNVKLGGFQDNAKPSAKKNLIKAKNITAEIIQDSGLSTFSA